MKQEVNIIKISKKDRKLIQIPKLESKIQENIVQYKQLYGNKIILGSIIQAAFLTFSFFNITDYISNQNDNLKAIVNSGLYQKINVIGFDMLPQLIVGVMIDLISFKSTQIFSVFMSIVALFINSICLYEQKQALILSSFLLNMAYGFVYTCVIYIIYESSQSFQKRVYYSGLFHLFSYSLPSLLSQFIMLFQEDRLNNLIINQLGILLLLLGTFLLYKSYWKIDQERQKSYLYKRFLRYQGVGITAKKIIQYFNNEHIIYCLIMSFSTEFFTSRSFPDIYIKLLKNIRSDLTYESTLIITYLISYIFPGFYILYFINTRKQTIQFCMKITSFILTTFIFVQIFIISVIQYQDKISYNIQFIIYVTITVCQGSLHLFVIIIFNQIMASLQDERTSIKCIGFALISIIQDTNQIVFSLDIQPIILSLIIFLVIILTKIYHEYYIANKSFDQLENKINSQ
ncbi:hypothetical protein ABPG74_000561 [Tetrahymena malaccensis]